ncbi:VOC family protein [Alteromonas sp. P256]|uniref:VOC family protein n=1 Tax=Alteromonas sp. P256 TaxID=3117399 RepID=UPI002FE32F2E
MLSKKRIRFDDKPSKKENITAVHSIDHFSLFVPELSVAEHFFSAFGLNVERCNNYLLIGTFDLNHTWLKIYKGDKKSLRYVSFNCFADDFNKIKQRVMSFGIEEVTPPTPLDSKGFWFYDQDQNLIQIKVGPKTSPNEKFSGSFTTAGPAERGSSYRRHADAVHPHRLAHILLFTPNVERAIAFYSDVLGLSLSDNSEDIIAFMHGVHGSDHHLVAFAKSTHKGFHHAAWDVDTIGEVGLGAMRMNEAGYSQGWGLGRHVLGSNYFHYVQDPWGSFHEYSCDIDYIPAQINWSASNHPPEDSLYLWGPDTPEIFTTNYE